MSAKSCKKEVIIPYCGPCIVLNHVVTVCQQGERSPVARESFQLMLQYFNTFIIFPIINKSIYSSGICPFRKTPRNTAGHDHQSSSSIDVVLNLLNLKFSRQFLNLGLNFMDSGSLPVWWRIGKEKQQHQFLSTFL